MSVSNQSQLHVRFAYPAKRSCRFRRCSFALDLLPEVVAGNPRYRGNHFLLVPIQLVYTLFIFFSAVGQETFVRFNKQ